LTWNYDRGNLIIIVKTTGRSTKDHSLKKVKVAGGLQQEFAGLFNKGDRRIPPQTGPAPGGC